MSWRPRLRALVLAALASAGGLAGCHEGRAAVGGVLGPEVTRAPGADDPVDFGEVRDFRLVAHTGESVTLASLRGRPFVVGAVFTRCYGPCPRITRSMRRLQDELADEEIRLVSISVDPEFDTPDVLAEYARDHGADPQRWLFLTGEEEEVHRFVREGLWLGVERSAAPESTEPVPAPISGEPLTHSTDLVVVDRNGRRRGWYDGEDDAAVQSCRERLRYLAGEGR